MKKHIPALKYWFSGSALYLAISFAFSIALSLIGIKEIVTAKALFSLIILTVIITIFVWRSAAIQGKENFELKQTLTAIGETSPAVEALKQSLVSLQSHNDTIAVTRRIIEQYDNLMAGISVQERFLGKSGERDKYAAAQHILDELKIQLRNVHVVEATQGTILIIKTAPNTFRTTYSIPARITPALTFSQLPEGVTANVIEQSNIGFTVVFTPLTIPVETFGLTASAEL